MTNETTHILVIDQIHNLIKEEFGNCVFVEIQVNCEGIEICAKEKANIQGYSTRKINGDWVE